MLKTTARFWITIKPYLGKANDFAIFYEFCNPYNFRFPVKLHWDMFYVITWWLLYTEHSLMLASECITVFTGTNIRQHYKTGFTNITIFICLCAVGVAVAFYLPCRANKTANNLFTTITSCMLYVALHNGLFLQSLFAVVS